MSNELIVRDSDESLVSVEAQQLTAMPKVVLEQAMLAAKALQEVISKKKKPVMFNGEQYLEFEDWQTVARFYGYTVQVRETKPVEFGSIKGFEAFADVLMVRTGQIVSSAESMCMSDEPNWAKKPLFQLRSMAQTRACAKAFRNVLAWVVVLAGYRATPAEEMSDGGYAAPAPTFTPKNRTPNFSASRASAENIDVKCNSCSAINGHLPNCKYHLNNNKAASDTPPAAQAAPQGAVVYELTVGKVESLKTKVVEKDGKKSGGRPFGKIYCHDANGTEMQVCIFHETPQKYMGLWQGKVCEFEITGKAAAQGGTMYSLDKVHKVGDVRYVDNAPAKDEAPDVGFGEE